MVRLAMLEFHLGRGIIQYLGFVWRPPVEGGGAASVSCNAEASSEKARLSPLCITPT